MRQIYSMAGFIVRTMLMYMDFEKAEGWLPNYTINNVAAKDHVREVEQKMRVTKEKYQGIIYTMPFRYIELVHFLVVWQNAFPAKSGTSQIWSSSEKVSSKS